MTAFTDSSALVKLDAAEAGSDEVQALARAGLLVVSALARVEVPAVEFAPGDGPALRLFPDDRKSPVAIDLRRAFGAPAIRGIRMMKTFARQGVVRARGKLRCDVPSGSP
ncbi:hypothetical protein [Frankia sp. Cas4]|uniref:hypothetical protein n=1 Tax=Frankia sp. Cas4 TaxID=3073927 RepID=UPI002AD47F73|nr:hypothetical protein [Frankia sp. Cas4]